MFGQFLLARGLITPTALEEALEAQAAAGEGERLPLGETLVRLGHLGRPDLERALAQYGAQGSPPPDDALRRLNALTRLFPEMAASRRLRDTLRRVLDAARECVRADCGFIATVDGEKRIRIQEVFETRARLPLLEEISRKVQDLERNHTTGIYRHVAATGRSYRTGDVRAADERYYVPAWEGVQSNLTVPILDPGGEVIGVVGLESVRRNAFTAADQLFLETLAGYAAIAIQRARESERREKEGRILWTFGHCMQAAEQGVVTTAGTKQVLEQVLDLCLEELGAGQGFIALVNPERKALEVMLVRGDAPPVKDRPKVIPLGRGVTGTVAATGEPARLDDVGRRPGFVPFFQGMRSELCVPLTYLGQVIGVLNIESRRPRAFTAEHLAYCRRLAETFAPLVHAAQFYDYTKARFGEGIQLVARSLAMARLKEILVPAARSEATLLLMGESGTGKEYLAKQVHFLSRRRNGPFEVLSCMNTQPELIESELFGHVAGAFTGALRDKPGLFELADGGTIFLDEIGDLQLELQGKLLRVLQEGTFRRVGDTRTRRVDVRVVAATNKDLRALVRAGRFREDLFYRLDQVSVTLPPLRERREDILPLTDHFVAKYGRREGRTFRGLEEDAVALLWRQDWPGNVRELEHFVYKLVLYTPGDVIRGAEVRRVADLFRLPLRPKIPTKLPPEELRREILMALHATRNERRLFKARAARYLGWDKNTLLAKMRALDISETV